MRVRGPDNAGERRVEQIVAERRRIDDEQPLRIGIDPVLHGQIHQNRAGESAIERRCRDVDEFPAAVVQ